MTKNEETLAAFADDHQRHCAEPNLYIAGKDNVPAIRCAVCHVMLEFPCDNDDELGEFLMTLVLITQTQDGTVQ